jgi:arylsulfatase A-like enzyme
MTYGRARTPNILLIVADQLRSDVVGSYGSQICRTPHLDRLGADGVRFETCIAPAAICSPARASLLTGLYPHGHGILNNTHEPDALRTDLPTEIPTFPELLRDAGYRLGYIGKWHVGRSSPQSRGFHDVIAHQDVVTSPGEVESGAVSEEVREPIYARYPRGRLLVAGIDPRPAAETETHADADAAIRLLSRYAELTTPFCMRVDFEGPHHPYAPPEPYASSYDPADIPPWPNFVEDTKSKPAAQARLLEQRGVVGWTWEEWRGVVARYFGFVTYLDAEIGRILDTLDRLGLAESTVVFATADHGDMTGSHGGQFNKGPILYDEVCRIPLVARGPGTARGGVHREPVGSLALMPTILDLAGVTPPHGLHIQSLLPALGSPQSSTTEAAFAEYHGDEWGLYSMRMIRTGAAKYVYSPHGSDELYDLEADPYERLNLMGDASADPLLAGLRERLMDWMLRTNDPLALWAHRLF